MSIKMSKRNWALTQRMEQGFVTKHCMHTEAHQIIKFYCWLNQIQDMFDHYLFATAKFLAKIRIIGRRATNSPMCERKCIKLKNSMHGSLELAT